MPHDRRFRFGVQVSSASSAAAWTDLARKAEDLGYATLFIPDHFGDQLAPLPALTAAACATTTIRLGTLVLDNDYRHPVVLAKELATLDLLSAGRLEVGIGAGWMLSDYQQSGIEHDEAPVRIDRMAEGLAVLKGLFADGAFSYEGEHYTVTVLDGQPKPVQRPHPPILMGGGGRRMLGIAAREADIVGINPALRSGRVDADSAADAGAEATDRKHAWVKDAAGDRYADLEINCLVLACAVVDDAATMAERLAPLFGLSADGVRQVPHALIGPVAEIGDVLRARRERWDMSYIVVQADAMERFAPVVAALAGT